MTQHTIGIRENYRKKFPVIALFLFCFASGSTVGVWAAQSPKLLYDMGLVTTVQLDLFSADVMGQLQHSGAVLLGVFFSACCLFAPVMLPAAVLFCGFTYGFSVFFYFGGRASIPGALIAALLPRLVVGIPAIVLFAAEGFLFAWSILRQLLTTAPERGLTGRLARLCAWFFIALMCAVSASVTGAHLALL